MPRIEDDDEKDQDLADFVRVGVSVIGTAQDSIRRVGNAWIGGNFTGEPRGAFAFDVQGERGAVDRVASGSYAIAVGNNNRAAGFQSVALGNICEASEQNAVAIGEMCTATNVQAVALGSACDAGGDSALAAGYGARAEGADAIALGHQAQALAPGSVAAGFEAAARVRMTVNLAGAIICKRSDPRPLDGSLWMAYYAGAEVMIMTPALDLTLVTEYEMSLPPACKLWLNEIGLIATAVSELVTQPTVRFGISGGPAKHRAAAATMLLTAAGKRERWTPLVPEDGETCLTAGVTSAAVATNCKGRAYWLGLIVEDESG